MICISNKDQVMQMQLAPAPHFLKRMDAASAAGDWGNDWTRQLFRPLFGWWVDAACVAVMSCVRVLAKQGLLLCLFIRLLLAYFSLSQHRPPFKHSKSFLLFNPAPGQHGQVSLVPLSQWTEGFLAPSFHRSIPRGSIFRWLACVLFCVHSALCYYFHLQFVT